MMPKILAFLAVILALLLFGSRPVWTQAVQDAVAKAAEDTLTNLYGVIRSVALPPPSEDAKESEPVSQRLVLLLPGKVLSYYDYFPGDAYEASLEDPHHDGQQVPLPPRVMETMFALADIIPGVHAFRGAETGESMAIIYENILNTLEVQNFNLKTQEEKKRYVTAIDYLAKEIPDPLNVTQNVTRLQLYRRGQDLYNKRRLDMEDLIDSKRKELPQIEFELWFQRNYPTLNSQVEGAYTEWLIFGQKEIVELYKSYLDVESPGIDLEKARMALRASGVSALDRTRTIYPVSFVPSDWYRYLTNVTVVDAARRNREENREENLSRDQIQYKIGELESKKLVLQALKQANPSEKLIQDLEDLKNRLANSNNNLSSTVMTTEQLRQSCLSSRIRAKAQNPNQVQELTPECKNYTDATSGASDDLISVSALDQCVKDLDFQINSTGLTREAIDGSIANIDEEIRALQTRLFLTSPKYPRLAQQAANTQDQLDSRWLQFQFDSSHKESDTSVATRYKKIATRARARGWWGRASASYSRTKSETSFNRRINSASVLVQGELLRVTIQRPWFRPSLFKSTQFHFRLDENARVSPGPMQEEKFIEEVVNNKGPHYLLPQYATGLLLARNVVIDFGLHNAADSYHAVRTATRASGGGGFSIGFFSAGASFSYGSSSGNYNSKVETTATGVRVQIPGVQLIGYYTQIVPKFPPR